MQWGEESVHRDKCFRTTQNVGRRSYTPSETGIMRGNLTQPRGNRIIRVIRVTEKGDYLQAI